MDKAKKSTIFLGLLFFLVFSNCSPQDQRKIDEKLIGTWFMTDNSELVIFTENSIELKGEKVSAYTELGSIISKETNLPVRTYRFLAPDQFQKSANDLVNSYVNMINALASSVNVKMTEEELASERKKREEHLATVDNKEGETYRTLKTLEVDARKGNLLQLSGSGQLLRRR